MSTPFVTMPELVRPVDGLYGFVFPMQEKEAPFGLIIFSVEPGACTEAHNHEIKEYWLITEGNGQVIYDEQTFDVRQGDFLFFEPYHTHQVVNNSDKVLKVVSIDWYGNKKDKV